MIRRKLRSWLVKWILGSDPAPMLEDLRRAVSTVRAVRADQWELHDRMERLERVAIVAVDSLQGEQLRDRVDPYLDSVGIVFCTAADALVSEIRPLERLTSD